MTYIVSIPVTDELPALRVIRQHVTARTPAGAILLASADTMADGHTIDFDRCITVDLD